MAKVGTGRWANLFMARIFAQNLVLIALAIATVGFVFAWLKDR
jgi:Na+/glutamate symporter